jgi:hypothetical protein
VNTTIAPLPAESIPAEFSECLARQRAACAANPEPGYAERIADLRSLARLLKDNRAALVGAINRDYGQRSEFETLFGEYWVALQSISDATRQLRRRIAGSRPGDVLSENRLDCTAYSAEAFHKVKYSVLKLGLTSGNISDRNTLVPVCSLSSIGLICAPFQQWGAPEYH